MWKKTNVRYGKVTKILVNKDSDKPLSHEATVSMFAGEVLVAVEDGEEDDE